MIRFVLSGGPIPAAHLLPLVRHFTARGWEHAIHSEPPGELEPVDGDAYVACDMALDRALEGRRRRVFQIQLQHNLTGLKGSDFGRSGADLHLLAGRRILESCGVPADDPRYRIRGYARWDEIRRERPLQAQRRREVSGSAGAEPLLPWVCFSPTGPNAACRSNLGRAPRILERLRRGLGDVELFVCDHARQYRML